MDEAAEAPAIGIKFKAKWLQQASIDPPETALVPPIAPLIAALCFIEVKRPICAPKPAANGKTKNQ